MCLCVGVALSGCGRATVNDPLTRSHGGNAPETQMEFWHSLSERSVTSNDEAFHGLLLAWDENDPASDYAARVAELKRRGWLPESFAEPADRGVTRGGLAVVLIHALDIRGGITLRLFGPTARYAVRELQDRGIYPPSAPYQTFTGGQFVSLIGRVEDFRLASELSDARTD